ncbi:MAG: hypothetical protein ABIG95_04955 [Candidatus Woesearchaeota archaeon]
MGRLRRAFSTNNRKLRKQAEVPDCSTSKEKQKKFPRLQAIVCRACAIMYFNNNSMSSKYDTTTD